MQNKMSVEVKYLHGDLKHSEYMYSMVNEALKRHLSYTGKEYVLPSEEGENDLEIELLSKLCHHFLRQRVDIELKLEKMPF